MELVMIYQLGGGEFWGFQGNRRDQSSPKEYEMRNLEQ